MTSPKKQYNLSQIKSYLDSGEYLPTFMQDFHDQKRLFRYIHNLYSDSTKGDEMPNWIQGHIYTIDWFLWFMASRGYKLQKIRNKNIEFKDISEVFE